MLIILMIFLTISSIMVLIVKRNKELFYIFGMCISLAIMLSGILLYIAKKGGISRELQNFFYFNSDLKLKIQYFQITLDQLGLTIAIGRYLFPLFLALIAFHYSLIPWLQRNYWVKRITIFIPIFLIILDYPDVFRFLTNNNEILKQAIASGTNLIIGFYIILSITLLIFEAYSIKVKYFQRKFILIISFILSLSLLYLLYFGQDPTQVYQLYLYENGIYYIKSVLSIPSYISIVVLNVILAVTGFVSLFKYTHEQFNSSREEITIQRKFDAINTGTSVFVHSMKNQLLVNRVIFKRINITVRQEHVDLEKLKDYIQTLSQQNENILLRIEELYRSVKTNAIHMIPVKLQDVIDCALERFSQKYPEESVNVDLEIQCNLLADKVHLSEAIYNLLINAQEAVNDFDPTVDEGVSLHCYNSSQYTVIEVRDKGSGISKKDWKKIYEPFYSTKNSNHNWGMGLHYSQTIAKEHFGNLRFESEEGKGSRFYLLLPKFNG
ncbi:HAMP domain-containing histidine kinase (plasmid) [Arthrobacter citreus]|nr:HAMP domain-containing histidine kinase [Arthrobacter citreus]